jgi:hypothetical protein
VRLDLADGVALKQLVDGRVDARHPPADLGELRLLGHALPREVDDVHVEGLRVEQPWSAWVAQSCQRERQTLETMFSVATYPRTPLVE